MSHLHSTSPIATAAARRRRLGAAATVATLALGSALAGSAATDAVASPDVAAERAVERAVEPSVAITLSVHGEDRRAWRPDGDARVERVRTVRFSWRAR